MNLRVRVSNELLLDAGTAESVGSELVIHPPATTLFRQVLAHLLTKPDPPAPVTTINSKDEGAAAAAVVLRWGSYLAVLADSAKRVSAKAGTSRISNSEMARINIEASAALAEWVAIFREDEAIYRKLVVRALTYLPIRRRKPARVRPDFAFLAVPDIAAKLIGATAPARLASVRADTESHANRVFANALVNTAWRNGPAENIHAGKSDGYPLDRRRVTAVEERSVLSFAADRLAIGMDACRELALEKPRRRWSEQILPYGLATMMLITPSGWTLTESSREVRLPRFPEPH